MLRKLAGLACMFVPLFGALWLTHVVEVSPILQRNGSLGLLGGALGAVLLVVIAVYCLAAVGGVTYGCFYVGRWLIDTTKIRTIR